MDVSDESENTNSQDCDEHKRNSYTADASDEREDTASQQLEKHKRNTYTVAAIIYFRVM